MNLLELERKISEGWAGKRGVPDGSGPAPGMAGKGRGLGGCPKREDFKTKKAYKKALAKWKRRTENAEI